MSWESSTQTERLSVSEIKAEQRARVGRRKLVEAPPPPLISMLPSQGGTSILVLNGVLLPVCLWSASIYI